MLGLLFVFAPCLGVILQVRGNCFCSVGSTSTHLQGSNEDQPSFTNQMIPPVDRLGLCRDQGVGCYVVSTAVQVGNIIPVEHFSYIGHIFSGQHHQDAVVHEALPKSRSINAPRPCVSSIYCLPQTLSCSPHPPPLHSLHLTSLLDLYMWLDSGTS